MMQSPFDLSKVTPSLRMAKSIPVSPPMESFAGEFEFSKQKYTLDKVIQVEGRQGIATNTTHYFVSSSTALYTYDLEGNLLMQNDDPFVDLPPPINHFGDIGYYDGELYTGVEY
jgi:hypothetical protein